MSLGRSSTFVRVVLLMWAVNVTIEAGPNDQASSQQVVPVTSPGLSGPRLSTPPTTGSTMPGPTGVPSDRVPPGSLSAAQTTLAAPLPPQIERVGPVMVEMGRPVRFVTNLANHDAIGQTSLSLIHAFAPGAFPSPTSTGPGNVEALVHWIDPLVGPQILRTRDGVAEVVPPVSVRRKAELYVTWVSSDGLLEIRLPASPRTFPVVLLEPQRSTVLEATGTSMEVTNNPVVPIQATIRDPAGVSTVTLSYRHSGDPSYVTTSMPLATGDDHEGRWETTIPRQPESCPFVDYFIEILNRNGVRSLYGSSEFPHSVQILSR